VIYQQRRYGEVNRPTREAKSAGLLSIFHPSRSFTEAAIRDRYAGKLKIVVDLGHPIVVNKGAISVKPC
jgi:hypothetical protein